MQKLLCLGASALLLAGCGSLTGPNTEYSSPNVNGRVVDADNGKPIKGARVSRITEKARVWGDYHHATGEYMIAPSPAFTDAEGRFSLPAEKGAYLVFTPDTSFSVGLQVDCWGYQQFKTNIDLVKVKPVRTSKGPEVDTGDLQLRPKQ